MKVGVVDGERFVDGGALHHKLDGAARIRGYVTNGHQPMGKRRAAGHLQARIHCRR